MVKTIKMRNRFTEKAKSSASGRVLKAKKGKKKKAMKGNSTGNRTMEVDDKIPVKRIKSSEVSCENFAKFFHEKEKLWKRQKKRQKLKNESVNVNRNPKPSVDSSSQGKMNKGQKLNKGSDNVNGNPSPFVQNTSSPKKRKKRLKLKSESDNVNRNPKPSGDTSSQGKMNKGQKLNKGSNNVNGSPSPFARNTSSPNKMKNRLKLKSESDNVNPKRSGETSLQDKTNKRQKLNKGPDNVNESPSPFDRNTSSPKKRKKRLKLKSESDNVNPKPSDGDTSLEGKRQKLNKGPDNLNGSPSPFDQNTSPPNKINKRLKGKSDNVDEDTKPSVGYPSSRNKKRKRHKLKKESDHLNGDKKPFDGNTSLPNKMKKKNLNNESNYVKKHSKSSDGDVSSTHKTEEDVKDPEKMTSKSPMMAQHRIGKQTITTSEGAKRLHDTMSARLTSSRFRYLNERLYSITSSEAAQMFSKDSEAYDVYHEGYKMQVKRWPMNPQDVFIKQLRKLPTTTVIADLGCGNAAIAKSLSQHKVLSYDLVAMDPVVTQCDMASLPLKSSSVDVAIFCLALMGVNLDDFIFEANRILKIGGDLKIAEVVSRFDNAKLFSRAIEKYGFELESQSIQSRMFIFFHFKKERNPKRGRLPPLRLKPCVYKKR